MATYDQSNFEENEMSSDNNSSLEPLKDLKSLDFNDMVNVISYFSMSLGEESMDKNSLKQQSIQINGLW